MDKKARRGPFVHWTRAATIARKGEASLRVVPFKADFGMLRRIVIASG